MWSQIRKEREGGVARKGWSRIRKVVGGKDEARQGFRGLGLVGIIPGAQEGHGPLAYPPARRSQRGYCFRASPWLTDHRQKWWTSARPMLLVGAG
jgi:hypothetical protein